MNPYLKAFTNIDKRHEIGLDFDCSSINVIAQKCYNTDRCNITPYTECSLNIVFFLKNFNILRPRLRQHWTAIGCKVNGQPIKVTVHSDQIR